MQRIGFDGMPKQRRTEMKRKLAMVLLVIVMAIMACGGDPSGSSDLSDPKWDMYFECTARQQDGGYSIVEAGQRCGALRPE